MNLFMDPIKIEKLQALNKYKRAQFIYKLFHYSILAYTLYHIFPSHVWMVSLCSSIKLFFVVSLPKIGAFFVGPKCLFLLFNVIVIILVGESKFWGSSTPKQDIYDEFVECNRSNLRFSNVLEKGKEDIKDKFVINEKMIAEERKEKKGEREDKEEEQEQEQEEQGQVQEQEQEIEEEEEIKKEVCEDFETEDYGLTTDVLNKKFDDFIAKVNQQRRREAKFMVCTC